MVDMEMAMNNNAASVLAFAILIFPLSYVTNHDVSGLAMALTMGGACLLAFAVLATSKA